MAVQPTVTAVQQASIAQAVPAVPTVQQVSAAPVAHGPAQHPTPAAMADTPVAHQVAGPVLALRAGGDGSHQLIVALHPAELGPVNLNVRITGELMTIQLASNSEIAHDTLRDALPQLRSELQAAGLGSVALSLDLTSDGSTDPGRAAEANRPAQAASFDDESQAPFQRPRSGDRMPTHASSGLDRWL